MSIKPCNLDTGIQKQKTGIHNYVRKKLGENLRM